MNESFIISLPLTQKKSVRIAADLLLSLVRAFSETPSAVSLKAKTKAATSDFIIKSASADVARLRARNQSDLRFIEKTMKTFAEKINQREMLKTVGITRIRRARAPKEKVVIKSNIPELSYEEVLQRLAKVLYVYRKKSHLTQAELAQRSGLSQGALSKWERGTGMMSMFEWLNLCRALGIPMDAILHAEIPDALVTDLRQPKSATKNRKASA